MDLNQSHADSAVACSFCGTALRDVRRLIAGPGCFICDECTCISFAILQDDKTRLMHDLIEIILGYGLPLLKSQFGSGGDQYGFTKWQLEKGLMAVLNKMGVYSSGNEGGL